KSRCGTTTFADSQPRCARLREKCGLANPALGPMGKARHELGTSASHPMRNASSTTFNCARQSCPRRAVLCTLSRHPELFGRTAMKSFLLACAAAIVVAAVAAAVLDRVQEPVQRAFAT